jgi:NAD(P)-dependent dehydrogenase (short-subunit alcohol dehydrogenase family)
MRNSEGQVAVVTGGTYGVGRGIASVLAQCGARVFVTGRSAHDGVPNNEQITGIRCDHRVDAEVSAAFQRIGWETGRVYILVNNVMGRVRTDGRRWDIHMD